MPNRVLRDWTTSETIDNLSQGAEVFFTRLIMKADDFGNYTANTKLLKAALFPLKNYSEKEISIWLTECVVSGIVRKYLVDGKDFINIPNFGQRLRAMKSQYPDISQSVGGHKSDIGRPETKRNEVETEVETNTNFTHNHQFNKSFAELINSKYQLPEDRGMAATGRNVDEIVRQLKEQGMTEAKIYAQARAMKSIYAKQRLTFPIKPETFLESFTAKDWIKELTSLDPERQAEQIAKTLKDANRRQPEPDLIGSSAPGSLG